MVTSTIFGQVHMISLLVISHYILYSTGRVGLVVLQKYTNLDGESQS